MNERRKLPRKYLVIYSRVFDHETGKVVGYLSDLSVGGAMIIGEAPLESGKSMMIRIDLPETPPFSKSHLDLETKIIWSKPDIAPSFHNAGLQFVKVSKEDVKIINDMIDAYEFHRESGNYPPSINSLNNDMNP
jgi:hypothetical protein